MGVRERASRAERQFARELARLARAAACGSRAKLLLMIYRQIRDYLDTVDSHSMASTPKFDRMEIISKLSVSVSGRPPRVRRRLVNIGATGGAGGSAIPAGLRKGSHIFGFTILRRDAGSQAPPALRLPRHREEGREHQPDRRADRHGLGVHPRVPGLVIVPGAEADLGGSRQDKSLGGVVRPV